MLPALLNHLATVTIGIENFGRIKSTDLSHALGDKVEMCGDSIRAPCRSQKEPRPSRPKPFRSGGPSAISFWLELISRWTDGLYFKKHCLRLLISLTKATLEKDSLQEIARDLAKTENAA